MPRLHLFADEAGTFDFRTGHNISKYFIVCTVVMPSFEVANDLLALKRSLAWADMPVGDYFHATTDRDAIRQQVFDAILKHDFSIQATIMEKRKAAPKIRPSDHRFYQYGWYYHFLHGMEKPLEACDELHVTAASIGTKKGQIAFTDAVRDVIRQTEGKKRKVRSSFWQCQSDPCLQVADYCTWAIQRKWERGDRAYFDLIADRITYEYDMFQKGTIYYYD
ncbi:DUF3800 domain-containing protein [Novosphingobium arvoryzae]|uniref:DUF3800 domain-containing protein n=1 Tax=Novosphingobium arvoryzae TaxID=1256514 RepID=UPI0035AFD324